ncbi:sucrose operon repressor ScrR [Halalkalibacter hemicellulosilyticusJCM 9152]|uniref:Sucrose operon repressor ScrR n=1 Tax=Halalkalibacter hemicellulosilyticusJCM 9152 TaxID=1236971 RepID=W4QBC0_9BACI|nr:sucrose operon repressor ScrR [Halalkalibacter hemicellulosilyticusJCM 9152]
MVFTKIHVLFDKYLMMLGEWKLKPKISDVAKKAGVSKTTVSRVLNNRGYISDKTKDLVYKAMEELHYVPNDLARSLYKKRSYIIGLIVPTTSNPFFGELTFHIENLCDELGYRVLLCNSSNRSDKEQKYWDMLLRNQVDGVIVITYNRGLINSDNKKNPVVAIDHYLSDTIPVIGSDNYEGGKQATELLVSKKCKQIIHIHGPDSLETPANLRKQAYVDVMNSYSRTPITYSVENVLDSNNHIKVISTLFDQHPDVDGIFASDDLLAAAVIVEAKKREISIPDQLKVIGYDGTETSKSLLPELSTIQQPIDQIAKVAIDSLLKMIENENHDLQLETWLPIKLIEGRTT